MEAPKCGVLMLISAAQLKFFWGVSPKGLLHVGAHKAEELHSYSKAGWLKETGVIWVEAQPVLAEQLKNSLDLRNSRVINAVVWDKDGVALTLKITSNSQSTSLLDLGTHAKTYPSIFVEKELQVTTQRLDSLLKTDDKFDFVNLDIQGTELQALIGLGSRIDDVHWIYTECNSVEVYKGCTLVKDLDEFLYPLGFRRTATKWVRGAGWGDCLYVRNSKKSTYILPTLLWKLYTNLLFLVLLPKRVSGWLLAKLDFS